MIAHDGACPSEHLHYVTSMAMVQHRCLRPCMKYETNQTRAKVLPEMALPLVIGNHAYYTRDS
jgi:hypothetical protein